MSGFFVFYEEVKCFGCSLPRLVSEYLSKVKLNADYVFACVTSASMPGNALGELNKLLIKNGGHLDYAKDIMMMNNYLVWSAMEEELELLKKKDVMMQIQAFVNDVKDRKKGIPKKKLYEKIVTYFADYSRFKWSNSHTSNFDKKLTVSDLCIGCGICEKVCPAANIYIYIDKKPVFKHQCEACLSCIHNCPRVAIHYVKEKSEGRFRNENVTLSEIIKSNKRN